MRFTCIGAAVVCLLAGFLLGLVIPGDGTHVDSFNDGFMEGICAPETRNGPEVWEDGSGRLCVAP